MSIENLIPLGETTLITNGSYEPSIQQRIASEIPSASKIEIVMAFITYSGIAPYINLLKKHVSENGVDSLRVITTTFNNITEVRALSKLVEIGAQVKVSYDDTNTRLHAKGWNFIRESSTETKEESSAQTKEESFSTTYIGSSNLTMHGLSTGKEWNVRASSKINPNISELYSKVFEVYWLDERLEDFEEKEFTKLTQQKLVGYELINLYKPFPFQQDILDELENMRLLGHKKNLLVAATGTGKTVIAAFEIKSFLEKNPSAKILFVAHREEILKQSLKTFRNIIGKSDFGEILSGNSKPSKAYHLFSTIISLENSDEYKVSDFHYVIIDEAHHSPAESYQFITKDISNDQYLLGLTATPERMDGLDIKDAFGGKFVYEIRLWDALNEGLLTPFSYYGLAASDISKITFEKNLYKEEELTPFLTNETNLNQLLKYIYEYLPNMSKNRCLIFCQSIKHAQSIQSFLSNQEIKSAVINSKTSDEMRDEILSNFKKGNINFILSVDVLNEGTDIPEVNAIILLRPTSSLTVFIQQLGRGLRKYDGKDKVVVLDFVYNHNRKYNLLKNYQALLNTDREGIKRGMNGDGFNLPEGSDIFFDEISTKYVLDNIRESVEKDKLSNLLMNYKTKPKISEFLSSYDVGIEKIQIDGWAKSLCSSGLVNGKLEKEELQILKKIAHCYNINDEIRINALRHILENRDSELNKISVTDKLAIEALLTLFFEPIQLESFSRDFKKAIKKLHTYPLAILELNDIYEYLLTLKPLNKKNYSEMEIGSQFRLQEIQIFTGRDNFGSYTPLREGVDKFENEKGLTTYLLYVTIDKSDMKNISHHYKDYAINRKLFHWQSQNASTPDMGRGKDLIESHENNNIIYLFARTSKDSDYKTSAGYYFLGQVEYNKHTGTKPISFTWSLKSNLSNNLYQKLKLS